MATFFQANGSVYKDDGSIPVISGMSTSGLVGFCGVTFNRASLKLIPLAERPLVCVIWNPETGVARCYKWVLGDSNTPDDFSVIDPGDGTGHWLQWDLTGSAG